MTGHRERGIEAGVIPKVSIVYLSFRRLDYCSRTFQALIDGTMYDDKEIIVVDQGGDEDVRDYFISMQEEGKVDKLILNTKNYGCGYASNEGFRLAEGEYIAYVQNDMNLFKPDTTAEWSPGSQELNWIQEGIWLSKNFSKIDTRLGENQGKKPGLVSYIAEDERTCPKFVPNQYEGYTFIEKSSDMQTCYNDHPFLIPRSIRDDIGEYSYGGHGPWIDHFPHNEKDYQNRFLAKGYYGLKTAVPRFLNVGSVTVMENPDGSVWHRECIQGWANDGKEVRDSYKWLKKPKDNDNKFVRSEYHGRKICR